MSPLQLILVNNSPMPGNMVVYQQYGAETVTMPPAWFSKYVYPGTTVSFSWDPSDYDFVWSGTGQIQAGVVFDASQVLPANLTTTNRITLSYDAVNHIFYFKDQRAGMQPGTFLIDTDATVPPNAAAVGIGMAGRATFAVQAQPNITVAIVAEPTYWVTFGIIQQGEFVTIEQTLAPVQVQFPVNVNSMTVTLNPDNSWTVKTNVMLAPAE